MSTSTEAVAKSDVDHQGTQFRRALLKLSGEALLGGLDYGVDPARLHAIARTVKRVKERGV